MSRTVLVTVTFKTELDPGDYFGIGDGAEDEEPSIEDTMAEFKREIEDGDVSFDDLMIEDLKAEVKLAEE